MCPLMKLNVINESFRHVLKKINTNRKQFLNWHVVEETGLVWENQLPLRKIVFSNYDRKYIFANEKSQKTAHEVNCDNWKLDRGNGRIKRGQSNNTILFF